MLFSLLYSLVRRLLGAGGRRPDERDIELLVLRHQVKVLQRQVKRPRLNRLDRVLLAAASRRLTKSSWSSFVVRPETLLRWHRELVRQKWTYRTTAARHEHGSSGCLGSERVGLPIGLSDPGIRERHVGS
jgi:putative transposase